MGTENILPAGLVVIASRHRVPETLDRLEHAIAKRGMTVLARIDHGAAALNAGLPLRPTVVLVFGNPRAGTPLMQAQQTMGIDLPLRALVWEDAGGQTWIGYNEPAWLAARHGVGDERRVVLAGMRDALVAVTAQAAGDAE